MSGEESPGSLRKDGESLSGRRTSVETNAECQCGGAQCGEEAVAVVPVEVLRRWQRAEDGEAVRLARERMGGSEPGIPLEDIMAETLARPE